MLTAHVYLPACEVLRREKFSVLVMFVTVELVTPVMVVFELGVMTSLLLSSQMISSKVKDGRVSCLLATHCTAWLEPALGTTADSEKI